MSEKTPRELGNEAEALYKDHKEIERRLASSEKEIGYTHEAIEVLSQIALGTYITDGSAQSYAWSTMGPENARNQLQDALQDLDTEQHERDKDAQESDSRLSGAAEHYARNESLYHELGVHEAALDGVHINVQQPEEAEERVDVKQG